MASNGVTSPRDQNDILNQINSRLESIQQDYKRLSSTVETINGRVNVIAGIKEVQSAANEPSNTNGAGPSHTDTATHEISQSDALSITATSDAPDTSTDTKLPPSIRGSTTPFSRIILSTYPGQSGIDPLPMDWGNSNPHERGPVVVSRSKTTVRRRNGKSASHICVQVHIPDPGSLEEVCLF